jgi:hypothetical protein
MADDLPADYDPTAGVITDYSQITKAPTMEYNENNNSIIFNNPIIPQSGIRSSSNNTLTFSYPVVFDSTISVRYVNPSQFVPLYLPYDPTNINIPIVASSGTIQTTDLMSAKD